MTKWAVIELAMRSVTCIGSTHISRVGFAKEQDGRGTGEGGGVQGLR